MKLQLYSIIFSHPLSFHHVAYSRTSLAIKLKVLWKKNCRIICLYDYKGKLLQPRAWQQVSHSNTWVVGDRRVKLCISCCMSKKREQGNWEHFSVYFYSPTLIHNDEFQSDTLDVTKENDSTKMSSTHPTAWMHTCTPVQCSGLWVCWPQPHLPQGGSEQQGLGRVWAQGVYHCTASML